MSLTQGQREPPDDPYTQALRNGLKVRGTAEEMGRIQVGLMRKRGGLLLVCGLCGGRGR